MVKISTSRLGFMLCAFLLPGLIGTFASFSIPAPVIDELHQQEALDAVLTAPNAASQAAAIAALADKVDPDTAALVTNGTGPLPARVAAAEQNMRREVVAQAKAAAYKIRLMVITMTVLGAVFGVLLMGPNKND
ncbi:hypothetical protein [Acidocella aromatica]|uniref:Transmembrane protein n=1 Tax=Acidocella aromatica TaxID=1303579 RepID=A0A840VEQ2_9PROT|nr:hypothetical protein [Acidocella aromatica]MBB5374363.1 hypothetical protein [Acidocella aromatica]